MFENAQLLHSDQKPENEARLEPGLLSVFRMIITVICGLQIIAVLLFFTVGRFSNTAPINWRNGIFLMVAVLNWVGIFLLLMYLYSKKLLIVLKQWFLPLALILYTVGSVAQHYFFLHIVSSSSNWARMMNPERPNFMAQDSAWGTLLSLLLPLVMIAWQYDFRRVGLYVLAIAMLEVPFIWLFHTSELGRIEEAFVFVVVIRTVIFLAVGYIVTRMIGAQRQQRNDLAIANQKLRDHAATLEQLTISHERNRMARELHDTLAHSLSAVSVQLEAVDSALESSPQDARRLLGKALAQTRSGLAETRRAMQSLRASPLDDLGLKLAVQTLAETTAQRGGMKLTFNMEDPAELSAIAEQDIYRIAQEALNNVLKHANATHLDVSMVQKDRNLILAIHDNGNGFPANAKNLNGHFGLQGMVERAELIGGKLTVESEKGKGTTIRLIKEV